MAFDYDVDFENTDFRAHPELYQVGAGEQGVLSVQPFKNEILPFWRFKDPPAARESSQHIYGMFCAYRDAQDFVGTDMARKFLQMGMTRAQRYANHKGGRKRDKDGQDIPLSHDPVKAECAQIFREKWEQAKSDPVYLEAKAKHIAACKAAKKAGAGSSKAPAKQGSSGPVTQHEQSGSKKARTAKAGADGRAAVSRASGGVRTRSQAA